jgi:outer membrane receptor for Fe3+-dicitrate
VKLEIPRWGPISGFVSYSNMLGVGFFPVTGGLFLGSDAVGVLSTTDRFPITQDQRNTVRSRFRYQVTPRIWIAFGGSYGSGLPVEFSGSYQEALAQYGPRITSRVNFDRGRVRPSFSLNASAGMILWQKEKQSLRLQGDIHNLTDRLNVINFAGVLSGTALDTPRSGAIRFEANF